MRYLRRQRISNKHNKNNLLPKVKIIFKRSIFIGDEFYFKIPLYPHGRSGENIKNLKPLKQIMINITIYRSKPRLRIFLGKKNALPSQATHLKQNYSLFKFHLVL